MKLDLTDSVLIAPEAADCLSHTYDVLWHNYDWRLNCLAITSIIRY